METTTELHDPTSETLRRAGLDHLANHLAKLHDRKRDIVVPAHAIGSVDDEIVAEFAASDDGEPTDSIEAKQTDQFRRSLAERLNVPGKYAERLWADDNLRRLYHVNVNELLAHQPDDKSYLLRTYHGTDTEDPAARVLLSSSYGIMDHLPCVEAVFGTLAEMDGSFSVQSCDLSPRNMFIRIRSDVVKAMAPRLLEGYVSPFSGARGADNPTVFAGFVIRNSETGHGALSITPELTVEICTNGMVMTKDVISRRHVGASLDNGVVEWSAETRAANVELVASQTRDIVNTCMSLDYVKTKIAELEELAGFDVPTEQAEAVIVDGVGGALRWSDVERSGILAQFHRGHQATSGGVMQAVTAYAQEVASPDRAYELGAQGVQAMEMAPRFVSAA